MFSTTSMSRSKNKPKWFTSALRRNQDEDKTPMSVGNPRFQIEHDGTKIHFLYCIVFSVAETKKFTSEELAAHRQEILDRIADAGLISECFYSVQGDEVYCKVGANDKRLLAEADAARDSYLLDVDPQSMKIVAEGDKDDERGPIHLVPPYSSVELFQKLDYKTGEWENLQDNEITALIKRRSKLNPFEQIHAPYNSEWEDYARRVYGVQIYRQYADGSILRSADRMKLIQNVLERSISVNSKTGTRGAGLALDQMRYDGEILGAFPLNTAVGSSDAQSLTVEELHRHWSGVGRPLWMRMPWLQPLNEIRDYFGEKIAIYFAFLSHYTLWLTFPAAFGVIVFTHQILNVYVEANSFNFLNPTQINEIALGSNATVLVARQYTEVFSVPIFALLVSLWATLVVEFWKRTEARHALRWGMVGFEKSERPRVEFMPSHRLPSPITGRSEPYYSEWNFLIKLVGSFSVLGVAIVVVLGAIATILYLKVALQSVESIGSVFAPQIALCINAVTIQGMGFIYRKVARMLNDWENHRSDTLYEDNLIVKTFIFNFVNSYTTLFYFAFAKSGNKIFDKTQYCTPQFEDLVDKNDKVEVVDNCFGGLGYSLLIIFAAQLIVNNSVEILIPFLTAFYHKYTNTKNSAQAMTMKAQGREVVQNLEETTIAITRPLLKLPGKVTNMVTGFSLSSAKSSGVSGGRQTKVGTSSVDLTNELIKVRTRSPAEDQFYLQSYDSTFNDFMELAVQFGYVTLFVAAFPLAPALALINNFLEVRVDSFKLCKLSRRPEMRGAQDIGTWQKIFTVLSYLAVASNAGVICFTSTTFLTDDDIVNIGFAKENVSGGRVWMFIIFILSVLAVKTILSLLVKDIPKEVEIQVKRNEYLVRKCFRRERDDAESREPSALRLERMKSGSNIHVAPTHEHIVYSSDPAITELLLSTARSIQESASGNVDFEQLFREADANDNGSLSADEFTRVLKESGGALGEKLTSREVDALVHALDTTKNRRIEYTEFAKFLAAAAAAAAAATAAGHTEEESPEEPDIEVTVVGGVESSAGSSDEVESLGEHGSHDSETEEE